MRVRVRVRSPTTRSELIMSDACGLLNAMQMASGYGPEDARQVQLHWRCHQLGALRRPIGWHYTGWQRRPLSPSLARGLWLCGGRQRRPLSPSFARGTWTPPSSTKVLPPPQAVYLAAHAFCIGITTLPLLLHALPLLLHACLSCYMPASPFTCLATRNCSLEQAVLTCWVYGRPLPTTERCCCVVAGAPPS